jgi:hypothetical protein
VWVEPIWPCCMVEIDRRFGGPYCCYHQDRARSVFFQTTLRNVTVVTFMSMLVLRVTTPCAFVGGYQRFGEIYVFLLQCSRLRPTSTVHICVWMNEILMHHLSYRNAQPPTSYHGENTGDISAIQEGHYDALKVSLYSLVLMACARSAWRVGRSRTTSRRSPALFVAVRIIDQVLQSS